jgi:hypothetical protein
MAKRARVVPAALNGSSTWERRVYREDCREFGSSEMGNLRGLSLPSVGHHRDFREKMNANR